jgi:hypothetical protein
MVPIAMTLNNATPAHTVLATRVMEIGLYLLSFVWLSAIQPKELMHTCSDTMPCLTCGADFFAELKGRWSQLGAVKKT